MSRAMMEVGANGFHGALILSPICPKCGALHDWRLLTNITTKLEESGGASPDPDDLQGQQDAIEGMLEHLLEQVRDGCMEPVRMDRKESYDA
jgi:hypothetical protein